MRYAALLTLAGAFAISAASASAQAPPVRFEVGARAGAMMFASDLPASFLLTDESGVLLQLDEVELDPAFTIGGNVGARIGERFGLGVSMLYSPLTYSTSAASDQDADLFAYGADFSYHATQFSDRVVPFLVVGAGAKTYSFEGADAETDFMWSVGGGMDVNLASNVGLRFEVRDYMSMFDPEINGFDSELQHDVAVSAGLRFEFGPPRGQLARRSGGMR